MVISYHYKTTNKPKKALKGGREKQTNKQKVGREIKQITSWKTYTQLIKCKLLKIIKKKNYN